ncbi:hypothetical protein NDU88_005468 [Pleurodeles waltl]|uniref:Uncharacterized protein n=1 Tax=Pleurodeles waltl TaxID=8319 RepID=A0AAV7L1B3_PLEWA|nr:hypothetical protein NDU88_005468 [Pleurodeles waltl]
MALPRVSKEKEKVTGKGYKPGYSHLELMSFAPPRPLHPGPEPIFWLLQGLENLVLRCSGGLWNLQCGLGDKHNIALLQACVIIPETFLKKYKKLKKSFAGILYTPIIVALCTVKAESLFSV